MKNFFLLVLLLTVVFFACKKATIVDQGPIETEITITEKKVRLKWNFIRLVHDEILGSVHTSDTVHGVAGDYFDFRADNKVYAYWDNVLDTVDYEVLDQAHLKYAGDTFLIKKLTALNFELTKTVGSSAAGYTDEITLSR